MDYGPRAVSAQHRITAASYGVNSAICDAAAAGQPGRLHAVPAGPAGRRTTSTTNTACACRRPCRSIRTAANGRRSARPRNWSASGATSSTAPAGRRRRTSFRAWRNLDSARSRVTSFAAQVRANEVALNGVRQEALVGSRTTLDVLNAEQELLNSQVSLISGPPRRAGELLRRAGRHRPADRPHARIARRVL